LPDYVCTVSTVLNGNKIKYYTTEIKADIKLCASSFSVVTLPVVFLLGLSHLLDAYMQQ